MSIFENVTAFIAINFDLISIEISKIRIILLWAMREKENDEEEKNQRLIY